MVIQEAVVLCGGLGTRLRTVVSEVPKPMAPVSGRPFLEYLLEYLRQQDIQRVVLSVGYKREVIVDHFGRQWNGVEVDYVVEEQPLGTGGGARLGLAKAQSDAVYLMNGDSFLSDRLGPLAEALDANTPLAMAVRREEDTARYGVCEFGDDLKIKGFASGQLGQPGFINAGVYALRRDLLETLPLPEAFSFENDFLAKSAAALGCRAVPCHGGFIDIGVPESFMLAQTYVPNLFSQ